MGRIEGALVVGGVEVEVVILDGNPALVVRGPLVEAGASVDLVIARGDRFTVVQDSNGEATAGGVTRLRHLRRECGAIFPAGDVTLDSGEDEALDAELLEESGEYRIERALLEAV